MTADDAMNMGEVRQGNRTPLNN